MSRVINLDSTGKRRNQLRRTIAELLRRLSQKQGLDEDARDMLALLVRCLKEIDEGIEQSALAWENRDYWFKAEELRRRWSWAGTGARDLEGHLGSDDPERIHQFIASLLPRFSDLRIARFMRKPALWKGQYRLLMQERSATPDGAG